MQTFIKTMNYTHLMPTRYNLSDVDLKKVIAGDALDSSEKKLAAKKVWSWVSCHRVGVSLGHAQLFSSACVLC